MSVDESVPVDQIPDISTSSVSNFGGQTQTYLPRNILSGEEQGKTAVFVGFVKHAKEPPNDMPTHVRHLLSNASYKMTLKFGIVLLQNEVSKLLKKASLILHDYV